MAKPNVTAQRMRELLDYNPETGEFIRRVWRGGTGTAGTLAGGSHGKTGYRQISLDGKLYFAHRLAWFWVHDQWPAKHIDHINGITSDNRIANLRDVSVTTNVQNQRRPRTDNVCGLTGVRRRGKRFLSHIHVHGRRLYLGTFDTAEAAATAYLNAKRVLHEGCTI